MRVLIIGIESFTGKHLAAYLQNRGMDVYGTAFKPIQRSSNVYACDITDKDSLLSVFTLLKPEYVINLAAISFVGESNKELFYRVNVLAVENILEAILETQDYSPSKVILVSSATVYGNQSAYVLEESMTPKPVNHYGISKLAMEHLVSTYFDKLPIVITRPFNYTGVGQEQHFLIPKIVSHFKEKKTVIELGNVDVYREFNDVEYVCEIYHGLLMGQMRSEVVNICSGRLIALKEVIDQMNKIAGYEIEIKVNPAFVRVNEIERLSGSTKKLYKMLGKIEQVDFRETLRAMYLSD